MNRFLTVLAVVALGAACKTVDGPPPERPPGQGYYVTLTEGLDNVCEIINERLVEREDLHIFQMDVYNKTVEEVHCEVRASWFDAQGIEVKSLTQSWRPYVVPSGSTVTVKLTAPSPRAVQCEVVARAAHAIK